MKKSIVIALHVAYWGMYLLLTVLFMAALGMLPFTKIIFNLFRVPAVAAGIIPGVVGFYSFYFLIFEKYLSQKRLFQSVGLAMLYSVVAAIVAEIVIYAFYHVDKSLNTIFFSGLFLSFIALVNGVLGLLMKGFITWYNDIQVKFELSKKNHEMELALIKAQINPHFLFNTINNIDTLIKKDAPKASDYLNKLSDIMRFALYESKTEKIQLAKEISYIDKYVELQKIRTSNENFIKYEVEGDTDTIAVEPMLLIPFVENAFKHSENKKIEGAIKITISAGADKLHFECANIYSEKQTTSDQGGLGNELIRRRLELLYPNKHIFEVTDTGGYYRVKLDIDLSGDK